ncbi:MAG: haloacid dehalogenase type II [Thermomicrobiales bacterium]
MDASNISVATFDCYGTLIDWEGGLANFLYDMALRHEPQPAGNGHAMRERWEAIQFGLLQGAYLPYKQVLAESLRAWMAERGYPWDDAYGEALVRAMRSWQPFPDTRPALLQAREQGLKLVILSNTDDDIIAHSLRHIDVPFEDVVTAEQCGAYKPALGNFETLLERVGVPPEQILHVAFGYKYDIGPAQKLGMRTAWINRKVETAPGEVQPDAMWRDLWGLAEFAGGAGPGF